MCFMSFYYFCSLIKHIYTFLSPIIWTTRNSISKCGICKTENLFCRRKYLCWSLMWWIDILFLIPLLLFSCGKEKEPFTHFDVGNGWLQAVEGETEQIYFASIEHRLCIWEDECVTVLTENAWNPVYGDGQPYFASGEDVQQDDSETNEKNTINKNKCK